MSNGFPQFQIVDEAGNVVSVFNGSAPGGGVSTEAKQDAQITILANLLTALLQRTTPADIQQVGGALQADQGQAGTIAQSWFVRLTDGTAALGTNSNPVRVSAAGSGLVVANFPTTQAVEGEVTIANLPDTQPVSGTVLVTRPSYSTYKNLALNVSGTVKASPGILYSLNCTNLNPNQPRYLQLFDKASAPVSGDDPVESYAIGPDSQLTLGADYFGLMGRAFTLGIAWGLSKDVATFSAAAAADQATHIKYV